MSFCTSTHFKADERRSLFFGSIQINSNVMEVNENISLYSLIPIVSPKFSRIVLVLI